VLGSHFAREALGGHDRADGEVTQSASRTRVPGQPDAQAEAGRIAPQFERERHVDEWMLQERFEASHGAR